MTATLTEAFLRRVEAFYSPTQPRDKEGQWTRTPGGKVWSGVSAHPDHRQKPTPDMSAVDEMRDDPEGFAHRLFTADLGNGARATVTDAYSDDFGGAVSMSVEGYLSVNGENAGTFKRSVTFQDGELSVYHDELLVEPQFHGQGIADRFNSHAVAEYQRIGVDHISLEAGLTVGGYAWARQGFRYNDKYIPSRQEFLHKALDGVEVRYHAPVIRPHVEQLKKEVAALRKAINAGEDIQPIHIASIGEKYARHTAMSDDGYEYPTWPGKSALIGRTWDGIYYFDAANPVTASATSLVHAELRPAFREMIEAFACHQASCRPPTSGGTGGSTSAKSMMNAVQRSLDDDLRRAPWKGSDNPMAGHCYVASEALYHMLGGKSSGWVPQFIRHEDAPHWFLRNGSKVLDPTASQFKTPVPYDKGKGKGFLTAEPSKRAAIVMQRAQQSLVASALELACHDASCRPPTSGGSGGSLRRKTLPDVAPQDVRFAYRPRHPDGHADPGEIVWAHVPFEDNPAEGKDRPVLIVGRTESGNLVGVQLSTKGHHKGSFPIEWGTDKESFLRPERFIQVDATNYRKEGAYVRKPKFQEIVNTVAKHHQLEMQVFVSHVESFACHDASCRPPTSGGTGGSSPRRGGGFKGPSIPRDGRIRPKQLIQKLDHDTMDELGVGNDHLNQPSRAREFIKSWYDAPLPNGYRTSDMEVSGSGGRLTVKGSIVDKDGRTAGDFERTVLLDHEAPYVDADGVQRTIRGTVVVHDRFVLNPSAQGQGIAEAFNTHSVVMYERYGVDHVQVHAGYEVGGYAWAVAGFRIDDGQRTGTFGGSFKPNARHETITNIVHEGITEKLSSLAEQAYITSAQRAQVQKELVALVTASSNGQDIQPIHIASIGERDMRFQKAHPNRDLAARGVTYETWPGKEMLMNTNWVGAYYFGQQERQALAASLLQMTG